MTIAPDGTVNLIWNNGDSNTVYNQLMKWINGVTINTGTSEGIGSQKVNIIWNDGTEE